MRYVLALGVVLLVHCALVASRPSAVWLKTESATGSRSTILLRRRSHRADDGSGLTNAPVAQPHGLMVFFTQYCNETLTLQSSQVFNGGWKVTPPETVPNINSGNYNFGFEAEADPGTDVINGTAAYVTPSYSVDMSFVAVQGEWSFGVSYMTYLGVKIQNADVGRKAIYNVMIGRPDGEHCAP